MDFSQFENELKKYRSTKLTRKDVERIEQDMVYVTSLFMAAQQLEGNSKPLSNALGFSCCNAMTSYFKMLLMGDKDLKRDGISQPSSNEVRLLCLARNENEIVKGKDKHFSIKKAFEYTPRFGLKEGTPEVRYETSYYELNMSNTILLLQKNKSFIKYYYEYVFQKHPELDTNDQAFIKNPLSQEMLAPIVEQFNDRITGTTSVNAETQVYLKYQKVINLLIRELENYYNEKPEFREIITSTYNKALQENVKNRENQMKKESIYRITNVIEFMAYMGYLDEAVEHNNDRALKLGLYPNLLCITEEDDFEKFVPKDKIDAIKRNPGGVQANDYALFSAFCLLNPEWKNKTLEEQAQTTLQKTCFPVKNLLDEKYYQDFSVEELLVCSAFYMNRLEKLSEKLMRGAFLHDKLNTLYDSVESGEIPDSIRDRIPDALKQRNFMLALVKDQFVDVWKNTGFIVDSFIDPEAVKRIQEQELAKIPDALEKKYKDVYQKYFSVYLKDANHDLANDFIYFFNVRNLSQTLYILKDMSLESLMMTFASGKSKINFGLIPEEKETISEYGEPQVLLGIDCENMPTVRLHYPKSEFERVKEQFYGDKEFPLYVCPENLKIGERDMTTPLFYKFTKGAKQLLNKMYSGMDPEALTYLFLRREYWNVHPNQNPLNSKKKEIRALASKKNSNNPNV